MHRYVRLVVGIASPLIGVLGNVLICLVFARRRPKNAGDIAIIALAVVDLISSSFNVLKVVVFFSAVSDVYCVIEMVSLRSGVLAAALLTVTIAVYRFRAIVTPFSRPVSPLTATWVSLGCILLAFAYSLPFIYVTRAHEEGEKVICLMFGDVVWVGTTYSWSQTAIFSLSSLLSSVLYFKIFRVLRVQQTVRLELTGQHVTRNTQPAAYVVSVNVSSDGNCVRENLDLPSRDTNVETIGQLGTFVKAQNSMKGGYVTVLYRTNDPKGTTMNIKKTPGVDAGQSTTPVHPSSLPTDTGTRSKMTITKKENNDHRTTVMLFIVSIIFFVSWLPSVANDVIASKEGSGVIFLHDEKPLLTLLVYAVTQLKYINHVINVFVYAAVNRRFREDCIQVLSWK
ncbi:uncharacterized protein [Diadema setosum]|uniref:uncharacterized protein n=1 Tax=Diadema setosum TaxID=31175 RepID=UPI003B3AD303